MDIPKLTVSKLGLDNCDNIVEGAPLLRGFEKEQRSTNLVMLFVVIFSIFLTWVQMSTKYRIKYGIDVDFRWWGTAIISLYFLINIISRRSYNFYQHLRYNISYKTFQKLISNMFFNEIHLSGSQIIYINKFIILSQEFCLPIKSIRKIEAKVSSSSNSNVYIYYGRFRKVRITFSKSRHANKYVNKLQSIINLKHYDSTMMKKHNQEFINSIFNINTTSQINEIEKSTNSFFIDENK